MIYNTASYKLIYIFSINDAAHAGLVKIGEATLRTELTIDAITPNCEILAAAARKRINEYTKTAGIKYNLLWTQLAVRIREDSYKGKSIAVLEAFSDHDVHSVLIKNHFDNAHPDGIKNYEWFKCDLETAKAAIQAVTEYRDFLFESKKPTTVSEPPIALREEQKQAVAKTLEVFKTHDKMLWNAKMRFGKTLTAYELIRVGGFQKTIIVTHRPVVEHGWAEDHAKIFGFSTDNVFMKKQNLEYREDYFDISSDRNNDAALYYACERGYPFTYFASMQDLRGSKPAGGKFDKNAAVFAIDWDLVIYDEAHEGTQTDLGQCVQKLLERNKNSKTPKVLELSGTPYNIIEKYDDNVFVWDYVMEQKAKNEWKHPETPNPYIDLPKMNIFTFDMTNALASSYRFETETSAFNFREFFRVWTGSLERDYSHIPQGAHVGEFVHEEDVRSFLNIITADNRDSKYPFASDKFRKEFKHTFWIVPGVAAARALSGLLQTHPVFCHYKIVNVAGDGDEEMPYDDALNAVQTAIREHAYTITLSCGKLTTGVTVREWTAVMMLTGSATTEAKGYMQTIFRVQSAGVIDGKQKENCYVFDFAPDRALRIISEAHQLSNKGRRSDDEYKLSLGRFLNYCPVYSINGARMSCYDVNALMRQLKRVSLDRAIKSGFEDDSVYKNDTGIVMDERDREFFELLKNRLTGHKKTSVHNLVPLAENGLSQAEYEKAKIAERKSKKALTEEDAAALMKLREARKQRQSFLALLRNISIRLPLLIFGANLPLTDGIAPKDIANIVDDESWSEFMPPEVSKDLFARSIKYFDEDVLIGAGLRIRRLVKQADEYPPTERVRRITELFNNFRNPDKETILTPWRVVNMHLSDCLGGYCFLDENFDNKNPLDVPRYVDKGAVTSDLFENSSATILEINSKSGLYPLYAAYSIYRNALPSDEADLTHEQQYLIWNSVLENNIFVLCKTNMAKDITVRTLVGFNTVKTNTHYQPHLLEKMKTDIDWVVQKLKNPRVWGKEGDTMKFDAIVGNPPYQLEGGSGGNNASPTYQDFAKLSELLGRTYVSLIMPSRWFTAGRENLLAGFRTHMMNNRSIEHLVAFTNGADVFTNVDIKGGICYYLINKQYNGLCNYVLHDNALIVSEKKDLAEFDVIIRHPILAHIVSKVKTFNKDYENVSSIISNDTPFGISSNPKSSKKNPLEVREVPDSSHDVMLYHIENNKRKIEYVNYNNLSKNVQDIKTYKVFIPGASGSGSDTTIIGRPELAPKNSVCSQSYLYAKFESELEAINFIKYLKTRFFRVLVSALKISQSAPKRVYRYVPLQSFTSSSDIDWSKAICEIDELLFTKYNLSSLDIAYINSSVKSMD